MNMVEAPGVEPGSRNVSRRASTGIVRSLKPRSAPTDRIRSTVASSISPQRPLAGSSSASPEKWPSVRGPGHAAGEGAPVLGSQCEVVVRSQKFCRCLRRPPDNLHLPHDVPSSGRNRFAPDRTAFTEKQQTCDLLIYPDLRIRQGILTRQNLDLQRRRRISRSISRFVSLSFVALRLSWAFLPRPIPISTLTLPFSLK